MSSSLSRNPSKDRVLTLLGESTDAEIGTESSKYIEDRLAFLTAQEAKGTLRGGRQQSGYGGGNRGSGGYNSGGDFLGKRGYAGNSGGYGGKRKFQSN